MTTPTPAERRAVAEIVLPDRPGYQVRYFAEGSLNRHEERIVLEDGLLRARIASRIGIDHEGLFEVCTGPNNVWHMGSYNFDTMLDALWECAIAHVREVERRKAEAEKAPFPVGTRVRTNGDKWYTGTVVGSITASANGLVGVAFDYNGGGTSHVRPSEIELIPPTPPAPHRFFPGERVVHTMSGRVGVIETINEIGCAWVKGIKDGKWTGENSWYSPCFLAPETAARMIPYGPEGGAVAHGSPNWKPIGGVDALFSPEEIAEMRKTR